MSTLKKIGLVTLALVSNLAFAFDQDAWGVGATALYVRPSFGGNGLGYSSFSNYGYNFYNVLVESNGSPNHLSNVNPKHDWGFEIEGTYHLNEVNDINVNWYHLNSSTKGHLPSGTLFAGSASALYAGQLIVTPAWDAVNVEVGQTAKWCDLLMRLHLGVEFARVQSKFKNYPQLAVDGSPIFITKDKISYEGFGPRLGADFTYNLLCDFDFYIKGAGSLLAGRAKQVVSGYHDLGGFNLYSTGNYVQKNSSVIVTEVEGKVGFNYDYQFKCSQLRFDVGYLWLTYLNSLVSQVGSGVVSSAISNSTAANFDLSGWYFGFTWS